MGQVKISSYALVFPGQGSQVIGMAKDFFENFKQSALVFEEASDTIHLNLKKLCFEGPADELTLTENLQPALFTAEAAMLAAMNSHSEINPVLVAGHSLGEFTANHAAGSLSLVDGVRLTRMRGQAMQKAVPPGVGTMAAILRLESAQVIALCKKAQTELPKNEVIEPANFNASGQTVVAGSIAGIKKLSELLGSDPEFKGGKCLSLQVSAPFHCSMMKPAQEEMTAHLSQTSYSRLSFPVLCNVTANLNTSEYSIASLLIDQITQPVLWEQSMKKLKEFGAQNIIEVGPGKVLTGLMKRIDPSIGLFNIGSVDQLKEVLK